MGQTNAERVKWLKRLRQRGGIKTPIPDFPLDLFSAKDWDDLAARLSMAWQRMPPWLPFVAVGHALRLYKEPNALFPDGAPDSVVARREVVAARFDVSVRTVERHEETGLVLLDYYVGLMITGPNLNEAWSEAFNAVAYFRWLSASVNDGEVADLCGPVLDELKSIRATLETPRTPRKASESGSPRPS